MYLLNNKCNNYNTNKTSTAATNTAAIEPSQKEEHNGFYVLLIFF